MRDNDTRIKREIKIRYRGGGRRKKGRERQRDRVSLNRYLTKTVGSARRLCVGHTGVCIIIHSILYSKHA